MAEYPAFPLWTDAYLGDTGHLTTIEHGAYLLLLVTMWRAGGSLPDDDKKLARFCRLTARQWLRIKPTMMEFFKVENGRLSQGRLTDELTFVRQHRAKQSDNAKARWLKTNKTIDAVAMPNECQTDAPTPTPTPIEDIYPKVAIFSAKMNGHEPDRFTEFWEAYPDGKRKYGRAKARSIFLAITSGKHKTIPKAEAADIIAGAKQRCGIQADPEYHVAPEVWLNGERWLAESKPALTGHLAQMEREGRL